MGENRFHIDWSMGPINCGLNFRLLYFLCCTFPSMSVDVVKTTDLNFFLTLFFDKKYKKFSRILVLIEEII
jgi:hypothetical protein